MIALLGKHFLYRHVRLDTNKPFYVGVGTKTKANRPDGLDRAFAKSQRSKWWKSIVNKAGYRVDILVQSDDYDFIHKKEQEFIKLYGRRDLNTGTLVNFTDGGEGILGWRRVVPLTEEQLKRFRKAREGQDMSYLYRSILQLDINGETINIYKSITEAVRNVPKTTTANITSVLKGKRRKSGGYSWKYVD